MLRGPFFANNRCLCFPDLQVQYTNFKNALQQIAQKIGDVEQEAEEHKCVQEKQRNEEEGERGGTDATTVLLTCPSPPGSFSRHSTRYRPTASASA